MAILKIEERGTAGNRSTLIVEGEIDLETVDVLRQRLSDLEKRGVVRVVLDMAQTQYVNSTALATLVKFAQTFKPRGGGIALASVTHKVKIPFEMLGLLGFFKFYDTVDAAVAAFDRG